MSLNLFQLIPLVIFSLFIYFVFKRKYRFALFVFGFAIVSLFFMPVKLTQNNIGRTLGNNSFNKVPEKIEINKQSFSEYQEVNFNKLKKESENENNN